MKKLIVLTLALSCAAVWTAKAADAKDTYAQDCSKCHGEDGKGQTKMGQRMGAKDFTDAKVQADMKDDEMAKAIKEGRKDSEGRTKMKAYSDTLSDADIKALVQFVRAFKK